MIIELSIKSIMVISGVWIIAVKIIFNIKHKA